MKILQIVHSFPPQGFYGTEVYTYELSIELAKRHQLFVFSRACDPAKEEYTLSRRSSGGIEVTEINNTFSLYDSFRDTYNNSTVTARFSEAIGRVKPDLVHIQHLLYLSTGIVDEIKKRGIPLVFSLHDYWLLCPQGQFFMGGKIPCAGKSAADCAACVSYQLLIGRRRLAFYRSLRRSPEAQGKDGLSRKNAFLKLAGQALFFWAGLYFKFSGKGVRQVRERAVQLKGVLSKADLFIAPSEFLRRKFIDSGVPGEKIVFLANGIKPSLFQGIKKDSGRTLRFAFIGNAIPSKGLHILIRSFNRFKEGQAQLDVYAAGSGYKSILWDYARACRRLVKNKNIKFMEKFAHQDVASVFARIDLLVVPSLWPENAPVVIEEAMASGTPVIASAIGGIPERIRDGVNGVLFTPGDTGELYAKMKAFVDDPDLLGRLKRNIQPPPSIEQNARRLEELYAGLGGETGHG